jgi:hypothetical protein
MGGTSDSSDAVRLYLAGTTGTGCSGSVGHTRSACGRQRDL